LMKGVTQPVVDKLNMLCPDCYTIVPDRDNYEYVYLTQDLINLSGKKFRQKKNNLNHFRNQYMGYEYLPITEDIFEENDVEKMSFIFDGETKMPDGYYRGIGYDINSQEDLVFFTEWILNYLKTDGQKFIETYSYLPNILKKMDELVDTGGYWSDLLTGGVPHLFKGLIISKLCNDPNFYNKIIFVDNIFATEDISEYLPYYEKLKERLKSVEPIYNV